MGRHQIARAPRRLQDREGLDVSRVGEHVEHAGGAQPEPVFMNHQTDISGETARMT